MNFLFKALIISTLSLSVYAQQATVIDPKVITLPRYTNLTAITTALPTPTQGMMVYNIGTKTNWFYDGTAWKNMAVSSVSVPNPLYLTSASTTITGVTNQADEAGVMGVNTTTGVGSAVLGRATSTNPDEHTVGIKGENMSTNEMGYGIHGRHEGTGWGGYFDGVNALKSEGKTELIGNTKVTGNIDITGNLQANGISGTVGQVLAKNSSNALAWTNTAYADKTRFKIRFQDNTTINNDNAPITIIIYNTNTTNISMNNSTGTVTFNKGGLYHFDVAAKARISTASNPSSYPEIYLSLLFPGIEQRIDIGNFHSINSANNIWILSGNQSFDMQINAGYTMNFYYLFANGTKTSFSAELNAHLISE